jgi:trans-2-enoyl-CoA reductase
MSQQLDNALGLNSVPVVYDDEKENLPAVVSEQTDDDVDQARTGLYDALSLSQQAVQDMLAIAQQSQHPKAYEILNSSIKTMADISMGLADLQLKKQRLNKGVVQPASEGGVTNNLFVGSTAELQQMIENMRNGDSNS